MTAVPMLTRQSVAVARIKPRRASGLAKFCTIPIENQRIRHPGSFLPGQNAAQIRHMCIQQLDQYWGSPFLNPIMRLNIRQGKVNLPNSLMGNPDLGQKQRFAFGRHQATNT